MYLSICSNTSGQLWFKIRYPSILGVEEWQETIRAHKHASSFYYFAFISHFNIFQFFLHGFSAHISSLPCFWKVTFGYNPLCCTATISAVRKSGLSRDAAKSPSRCDSPTHNIHTTAALSSSTPPLHQLQMLLFVLEMSLFSKRCCPIIYMRWIETLIFCWLSPSWSCLVVWLWLEVSVSKYWAKENLFAYCNCKGLHENVSDCTRLQLLICPTR